MSYDSCLDWRNEVIRVCTRIQDICCKMQEAFVSNKESIENTDQNSKDAKLIEEKSFFFFFFFNKKKLFRVNLGILDVYKRTTKKLERTKIHQFHQGIDSK